MFGFSLIELLLILLVVLLFFGSGKLPQIGKALGGSVRSFRKAFQDGKGGGESDRGNPDK